MQSSDLMRWDWYAATIRVSPKEVIEELLASQELASFRETRAMHGYTYGGEIHRGDTVLTRLLWGGNGDGAHAWASGDNAEWFAGVVRDRWPWPEHGVTRGDVAVDYEGSEAWELLSDLSLGIADKYRLKVHHIGDFHRCEDGRTLYIGARSSVVRVRVYEKGKQLSASPEWVRTELVVKPSSRKGKAAMARAEPNTAWGASRWTKELSERLGMPEVARLKVGTVWRDADEERAYKALVRQYGPMLQRMVDRLGSWCAVGNKLGQDISGQTNVDAWDNE